MDSAIQSFKDDLELMGTPVSVGEFGYFRKWSLSHKSGKGGWIVQSINMFDGSGTQTAKPYWEAWHVSKGARYTDYSNSNQQWDDSFRDLHGTTVEASARFYEGLKLPDTFKFNNVPEANGLKSTYIDPHLATDNATAEVNITVHF
jgi:hypothetical protein